MIKYIVVNFISLAIVVIGIITNDVGIMLLGVLGFISSRMEWLFSSLIDVLADGFKQGFTIAMSDDKSVDKK